MTTTRFATRLALVPVVLLASAWFIPRGTRQDAMPMAGPDSMTGPTVRIDDRGGRLIVSIGPMDIPSPTAGGGMAGMDMGGMDMSGMAEPDHHAGMVMPPVGEVVVPFDAWAYAFHYDVVDADGKEVPHVLLHHLNVIDPNQRDLFLPISYRVAAMGSETGRLGLPRLLFGHPLRGGQRLVIAAMMHNPTDTSYTGVTVRFMFDYVKTGRPWPLFPVYTFQMDVMFPVGDKDFDLPPGRSSKSWEGKPAVAGRILGVGGHLHQYAERLVLEDVTAGDTIWEGKPILDDNEQLIGVSIGRLYWKLGVEVSPEHVYRASVEYDNPTADTIPKGGMGLIAGVFMPSGPWPRPDADNEFYQIDRMHYLREVRGSMSQIMSGAPPAADHDHGHDHQH